MNTVNLLQNIILNLDLNSACLKYSKMKGWAVKEEINGLIRRLDGRIPHSKLAMNTNSFNEVKKESFMTLLVGIMVVTISCTVLEAVAITAIKINVSIEMVLGGS